MQNEQQLLFLLIEYIVNKSYYHFEFSHSAFLVLFGMLNGGISLKCLLLFSSVGKCCCGTCNKRQINDNGERSEHARLEIISWVFQDNQDKSHQSRVKERRWRGLRMRDWGVLYIISTLSHCCILFFFLIFTKLFTSRNFTNREGKLFLK